MTKFPKHIGLLVGFSFLYVNASFSQSVIGTRESSTPFFHGGDEVTITLRLQNPGTQAKTVTVEEAVPEGWTVVRADQNGQVTAGGGSIQEGKDEALLNEYSEAPHFEDFNKVEKYWNMEAYPYAGKSTVNRGDDTNEADAPQPLGVRDLQLHPPNNDHNTVAAFIVPVAGSYTVSDLAARRPHNEGDSVWYILYDSTKAELTSLQAFNDQVWIGDTGTYNLGSLKVGDRIYFAVNRDGDFGWDATEVAFTIKTGSTIWHSYDVVTSDGFPQATLTDEAKKVTASLEFYESSEDFGVDPIDPGVFQAKGPIIRWSVNAAPGATALTYVVKAPEQPTVTPLWYGIGDQFSIRGIATLKLINKAALVKGVRQFSRPYFKVGEEFDVIITLTNFGSDPKTVQVVEAIPQGWDIVSNGGGTVSSGGQIDPIDQGLFTVFNYGMHVQGFNKVQDFWAFAENGYPYAGKSAVRRGEDANEADAPQPLGVYDLQLHPPNNDHNTVAAFVVPVAGTYTLTDLAVRRPHNEGATVSFIVYNPAKTEIANLQAANDQIWVQDPGSYNLGSLKVGDRIYFALNRDGDYGWDATEVAFTIASGSNIWHSYDAVTVEGYPQATLVDEAGRNETRIDFYESTDDFGIERNSAPITVSGQSITWSQRALSGTTAIAYRVKAPASGSSATASWIGTGDGISIGGNDTIPQLQPGMGLFDGHLDIGDVAVAGNAAYNASTQEYEVTGSGADIWGAADEFHFLFKEVSGNFTLKGTVMLDPLESTNDWAKAGLMVRDSIDAGSVFYDAIVRVQLASR